MKDILAFTTGVDKFFRSLNTEQVELTPEVMLWFCLGLALSVAVLIGLIVIIKKCVAHRREEGGPSVLAPVNMALFTIAFTIIMFSTVYSSWWLWLVCIALFIVGFVLSLKNNGIKYGIMHCFVQLVLSFVVAVIIGAAFVLGLILLGVILAGAIAISLNGNPFPIILYGIHGNMVYTRWTGSYYVDVNGNRYYPQIGGYVKDLDGGLYRMNP